MKSILLPLTNTWGWEIKKKLSEISEQKKYLPPHQVNNKFAKETLLFLWRNEKYFSVLLIYQLFGNTIWAKSD